MDIFISELLGTFFLILLGNGVVANVVLKDTKGNNSGWIVITFGWAIAVFVGVIIGNASGGHLNPAVSLAMLIKNNIDFIQFCQYISAQTLGAFLGACTVYIIYKDHYDRTDDQGSKLATFSTSPAIKNTKSNLISEIIGTFTLVFAVLMLPSATNDIGGLVALPVALIVFGIGLSLGGTTGYAINPARDLGPRIAHELLSIKNKGRSDWSYAWIPIVGPFIGAALATYLSFFLNS
jgi:glycerol uptake facilitator protein